MRRRACVATMRDALLRVRLSCRGALLFYTGKGSIMDQQPHTEPEEASPTSNLNQPNAADTQQDASTDAKSSQKPEHNPHKTRRIAIIVSVVVIAAVAIGVFALTYCPHEWAEANCSSPKTCLKCGKTEGEPLGDEGHVWDSATCTKPKTCSICGKTEGSALGHKWEDQTYEKPKTCSRCGATEGKSLKDETDDLIADLKQDLKRSGEHKRYNITIRPS